MLNRIHARRYLVEKREVLSGLLDFDPARRHYAACKDARSLSDIAVRDEANEVRQDARPQAGKNRRCIHWNTLRIFSGRERRRWLQIVRRSRKVNVGQVPKMWKKNFLFRAAESTPLTESENELFHDTEPALDSAGLVLDKFLSVWVQGEGTEEKPSTFTNLYVRTAMLDVRKHVSLLQPLQGRSHQIKQLLTKEQKQFLRQWLEVHDPQAWESSEDHFQDLFEPE